MRLLFSLLLIAVSVVSASASTETGMGWLTNGSPAANTDARKARDGFGASVLITSDRDWKEKWESPTTPNFTTVDTVSVGERATVLIFFANPKTDASENVNVTCDIKVTSPDSTITEHRGVKGYAGKLKGLATDTYLSEAVLAFSGEPTDPKGKWYFDVTVHDNNRGVSIPLRAEVSLTAERKAAETMSQHELNNWMTYYYLHPDPINLPRALHALKGLGFLEDASATSPYIAFFSLAFRRTPAMIAKTFEADLSREEKAALLRALWLANIPEGKEFLAKEISIEAAGDTDDLLKKNPLEVEDMPIDSPEILDLLWGAFLATGDERYVLKIISVLPWTTARGDTGRLLVGGAAQWSLTSNAVQHDRVLEICMSRLDEQPPDVRSVLSKVIEEAKKEREKRRVGP